MHKKIQPFMARRRVVEFFDDGDDDPKHVASFRRHVHRHLPEIVRRPGCYVIGCLMLLAFSTISLFLKFMLLNSFEEMMLINKDQSGGHFGHFILRQKTVYQSNSALGLSASTKTTPQKLQISEIWKQPESEGYYKCINVTKNEPWNGTVTNGYILARANGGLNQMKTGISDLVAIAKLMNATLVLPSLDHRSFWTDSSEFKDIFNWQNFIEVLRDEVHVIESIPSELSHIKPFETAPVSWSKPRYYRVHMASLLKQHKVIRLTHTDSRLANNGLAESTQKLRCRAMYEALMFNVEIEQLGNKLAARLRSNGKPYLAHIQDVQGNLQNWRRTSMPILILVASAASLMERSIAQRRDLEAKNHIVTNRERPLFGTHWHRKPHASAATNECGAL